MHRISRKTTIPALFVAAISIACMRADALEFVFIDEFEPLPPASERLQWFLEQLVSCEPITDAVESGMASIRQIVLRTDAEEAPGGPVANEPDNTPFSLMELAELMLGISDNTATGLLHEVVGRDKLNLVPAAFGHAQPELLVPFLNISETFHLLFSVPFAEANAYLNGSEAAQADFVTDTLVPLGSFAANGGGFNNADLTTTVTWRASPLDICNAFARHRT